MRSIKSEEKFDEIIKQLSDASTGTPVFSTMRELMCFAAVLGFENDKRKKVTESPFSVVDGRIFEKSALAIDLLYLIALASEKNAEVLKDDEKVITIFEEFALGGLEILQSWLHEKPEDINGDRAILEALHKYNFLSPPNDSNVVIENITF